MDQDKIENAVNEIGSDIFLSDSDTGGDTRTEETTEELHSDTETEANETETTTETSTETVAGKTTDEQAAAAAAAAPTRPAPKAWGKEHHERWGKLDKETQDYIELREKQMLEGLTQYGDKAKRSEAWDSAVKDYLPLIQQQGTTAPEAVRYLFEAHKRLSVGSPEDRAAYLNEVAAAYGIDIGKAAERAKASGEESPAVRELRERTERLEHERAQERELQVRAINERIATDVQAFCEAKDEKGNPKHPYFDECAADIVAYINAGHTLDKAYEKAVYANPVTRAKELARLQTEAEANLRAKAKKEAETARNASRPNVNSRDTTKRATPAKAPRWEDGMDETLKEIKARQTH